MPDRSPGRPERFESEWKVSRRLKAAGLGEARGQGSGRRVAQIDVSVAFVREHCEVIRVRQSEQCSPIIGIGHRAFGIGGRADIGGGRAFEHRFRKPFEGGQEAGLDAGRHEDGLGARRQDRSRIGLVEGVGQQDRWPRARLCLGRDDEGREEQTFARPVERQEMAVGIDRRLRQAEAAPEPALAAVAPFRRAVDRRIFAEFVRVSCDRLGDEGRHRAARIADCEVYGRRARRNGIEQRRELGEGRRGKLGKAAGEHGNSLRCERRAESNRSPSPP